MLVNNNNSIVLGFSKETVHTRRNGEPYLIVTVGTAIAVSGPFFVRLHDRPDFVTATRGLHCRFFVVERPSFAARCAPPAIARSVRVVYLF